MTSIICNASIRSKVIPVNLRQSKVSRYAAPTKSDLFQLHAHVGKLSVYDGWILMVLESDINCIDLRLQHSKDVHRFLRLAGTAISKRVVRPHEAYRSILIIFAVADRVVCPIKVPSKAIDLAIGQTQLVFKLELVIRGGNRLAIGKGQSDRISNKAVLCVFKLLESGSEIIWPDHSVA